MKLPQGVHVSISTRQLERNEINLVGRKVDEAVEMAKAGADAIIAHVGTTVGGSIGVTKAVVPWDDTLKRTQAICGRLPTPDVPASVAASVKAALHAFLNQR